ncbi:hypothetical protein [Deinococcus murrayi]|uniref:hypothetical protein n=1 Tax=Deinococcus murrayi TaxID=68910 RepID=UPI000486D545|nr:hypothetical protein [Deinococcus murrayi]
MHIPNPILLAGATPASGLILEVTAGRGGLAGYILLGQHGPPAAVEVSGDGGTTWEAPSYPHALAPGLLRLTRTDESASVTTLRALAPVDEAPPPEPGPGVPGLDPYTVITDAQGYQTITNADATTDADGYQTISDGAATADAQGYESVEREGL